MNFYNDQISDFGLEVLKIIKEFPGIKVPELVIKLQKRNLYKYIEYKGSNKTSGYYLK